MTFDRLLSLSILLSLAWLHVRLLSPLTRAHSTIDFVNRFDTLMSTKWWNCVFIIPRRSSFLFRLRRHRRRLHHNFFLLFCCRRVCIPYMERERERERYGCHHPSGDVKRNTQISLFFLYCFLNCSMLIYVHATFCWGLIDDTHTWTNVMYVFRYTSNNHTAPAAVCRKQSQTCSPNMIVCDLQSKQSDITFIFLCKAQSKCHHSH